MATWVSVHPRMPDISVDIAFADPPTDATPTWTSVSSRLRAYTARLYRQSELDEFQTGEFTVTLDNRDRALEPAYASSAYYPNVVPRKRIRVQARYSGVTYDRIGGFVKAIPVSWPSQKDAVVVFQCADFGMALNRAQVTIDGYPEELAHLRIGRVLDAIGVAAADRAIDTATHTLAAIPALAVGQQPTTVGALEHCRAAALSDGGYLFVARNGVITFHNRAHRRDILGTPAGTFGDAASGEIPYSPDLVAQMDDARLWNRATVLTADAVREESSDATSEAAYWSARRDDFQSLLARPGEAAALASLFVWRYKDPRLRFPAISLIPETSHSGMDIATCLSADVGTRFTLKRRPSAGGTLIQQDVHVEGISESVQPGMWNLTFDVGPADPSATFWTLGTSSLNSTAIVGY